MQTFTLISLISNILLGLLVLVMFYPKVRDSLRKRIGVITSRREKRRQMENARLVKMVRKEVIRYLEELKNS